MPGNELHNIRVGFRRVSGGISHLLSIHFGNRHHWNYHLYSAEVALQAVAWHGLCHGLVRCDHSNTSLAGAPLNLHDYSKTPGGI